MDQRSTEQLSQDTGTNTSAVPFGPVLKIDQMKTETVAKVDASSTSAATAGQYDDRRIYVSNIPFSYRSHDLVQMFSPFGVVSNAEIVMNERGSKGFGFVTLDTKEGCDAARAALHGTVVQGRVIEVKKATTAPYRRNAARGHQAAVHQQGTIPLRADFLAAQLPQLQAQSLLTPSVSDSLNAIILAQYQSRLQSLINPYAVRDPSLLFHRSLPQLQQQAALMSGGIPISPLSMSSIPMQLLCASRGTENLPPNAYTATMMPLTTPGITYASLPGVNPNNIMIPSTIQCRLPQDAANGALSNFMSESGFFKSPAQVNPYTGCIDLTGSLGLMAGVAPSFQPTANSMKDKYRASGLRAFDQSCVIDTSFHGEPLKEGQFGPIGRAVPAGGNSNQVNSTSNDFRAQTSMAPEETAYEYNAGQSGGNNSSALPVYHPFEPSTDRNGRKRLSSIDSYHLSKKQAKSTL